RTTMRLSKVLLLSMVLGFSAAAWGQNGGGGGNGGNNGGGNGEAAGIKGTGFRGGSKSFGVVDNKGVETTIPITASTSFLVNKAAAGFQDVVKRGMRVRATAAADGSAAQVVASGMARSLNGSQLQAFLGASDQEWQVIKPKIDQ